MKKVVKREYEIFNEIWKNYCRYTKTVSSNEHVYGLFTKKRTEIYEKTLFIPSPKHPLDIFNTPSLFRTMGKAPDRITNSN